LRLVPVSRFGHVVATPVDGDHATALAEDSHSMTDGVEGDPVVGSQVTFRQQPCPRPKIPRRYARLDVSNDPHIGKLSYAPAWCLDLRAPILVAHKSERMAR
jgi:hypothetical protein